MPLFFCERRSTKAVVAVIEDCHVLLEEVERCVSSSSSAPISSRGQLLWTTMQRNISCRLQNDPLSRSLEKLKCREQPVDADPDLVPLGPIDSLHDHNVSSTLEAHSRDVVCDDGDCVTTDHELRERSLLIDLRSAVREVILRAKSKPTHFTIANAGASLSTLLTDLSSSSCFPNVRALTCEGFFASTTFFDSNTNATCLFRLSYPSPSVSRTTTAATGPFDWVRELHLTSIAMDSSAALTLAGSFRRLPNLRLLDVSFNKLGVDGAVYIADHLRHVTWLEVLRMAANRLIGRGGEAICQALRYVPSLSELNLSRNMISGGEGGKSIAAGIALLCLTTPNTRRESVDVTITANRRPSEVGQQSRQGLRVLDLSHNALGELGVCRILHSLSEPCLRVGAPSSLRELHLRANAMGTKGIAAVIDFVVLHAAEHLELLDVSHNEAQRVDVSVWSRMLRCSDVLFDVSQQEASSSSLSISRQSEDQLDANQTTDPALPSRRRGPLFPRMATMLVHANQWGGAEHGATVLGALLRGMPWLKILDLSACDLQCSGITWIASHGLRWLPEEGGGGRLQLLDVSGNRIAHDGTLALAQLFCEKRHQLQDTAPGSEEGEGKGTGSDAEEATGMPPFRPWGSSLQRFSFAGNLSSGRSAALLLHVLNGTGTCGMVESCARCALQQQRPQRQHGNNDVVVSVGGGGEVGSRGREDAGTNAHRIEGKNGKFAVGVCLPSLTEVDASRNPWDSVALTAISDVLFSARRLQTRWRLLFASALCVQSEHQGSLIPASVQLYPF